MVDQFDEHRWRHRLRLPKFAEIMNPPPPTSVSLDDGDAPVSFPLQHIHKTAHGFAARQAVSSAKGISWRFNWQGDSVVTMPLPYQDIDDREDLVRFLAGYAHLGRLVEVWEQSGDFRGRVIDLGFLLAVMVGTFHKLRHLLRACEFKGYEGDVFVRLHVNNPIEAVPFLDIAAVADQLAAFGLPLAIDSQTELPSSAATDAFRFNVDTNPQSPTIAGTVATMAVANSLGFSWGEQIVAEDGIQLQEGATDLIADLFDVLKRALAVQERRNRRR